MSSLLGNSLKIVLGSRFGQSPFEMLPVQNSVGAKNQVKFALLTEDKFIFSKVVNSRISNATAPKRIPSWSAYLFCVHQSFL
jgi:hypothetical protein